MKKSKFDNYFEICRELPKQLSKLDTSELKPILDAFENSTSEIQEWLDSNELPASKSAIATGLEQGINEIPNFFEGLPNPVKTEAFSIYYGVLNSVIPNYFEKLAKRIDKIIARRKIKNESEYYLIREKFDQIEDSEEDLKYTLDELLVNFEQQV